MRFGRGQEDQFAEGRYPAGTELTAEEGPLFVPPDRKRKKGEGGEVLRVFSELFGLRGRETDLHRSDFTQVGLSLFQKTLQKLHVAGVLSFQKIKPDGGIDEIDGIVTSSCFFSGATASPGTLSAPATSGSGGAGSAP